MPDRFFLATAIDYTNGAPHIGHAYEKILADVIARYRRLRGDDVFFLTGVDQHGQKVQQSAQREGVEAQAFVDANTAKFQALWEKLGIKYDGWAATTGDRHKRCVRGILQRFWDGGQIYKDKQGGYYSVRQEQFLTDKERNENGEFGPEWGEVEFREEENYYFRLAEHKEWLLELLDERRDLVVPDFRLVELRNAIEKLSGDLCISRPKSRLNWGIELPFDPEFVTYVWFDALVNYISFAPGNYTAAPGTDLDEFNCWWPATIIIGKDTLIPAHGIYWLSMLHALGFGANEMPRLIVHGWWNISGAKMSKSLGNVVDPNTLAEKYGAEALRYYLMSDIATGKDADFSEDRLVERYNSDLANGLGNLLNRALSMLHRYREGRLHYVDRLDPSKDAPDGYRRLTDEYRAGFASDELHIAAARALENMLHLTSVFNAVIEVYAPWKLAKSSAVADQETLDGVLYDCAELLRIIGILISPVLPKAAHGIFDQLNLKAELSGKEERFSLADAEWGKLPDGHIVGKPIPLFPRIEIATS
ncbi:MAG: class I tRNA ligase family protein [Chthoniobacterales bacterium]